ncbi:SDR family NAD(P)-dependent oxidoreductase [Streptomyces europaeiscabiei]|uniref:SDR family NAD(P)-dependent oxidoreductase n=1 Tax=Streptomyces europaeiscabiei TaxID=146819 RepID=UPI002E1774D8
MTEARITLVTGANKGLGLQTARSLVAAGHTVYVGARDARRGREAALAIGARPLLLDVTSDESVAAAAAVVKQEAGHLDVLVNNAGVGGVPRGAEEIPAADLLAVYDTNVFGVVRVMHAFLPLLLAGKDPVVVNVSSGMGSLAVTNDPDRFESSVVLPVYTSSKAALNMLTSQYAKALPGIRINAVDPGFTATDINGHQGTQTVEEGAEIIVRMAAAVNDVTTGGFFDSRGVVPW